MSRSMRILVPSLILLALPLPILSQNLRAELALNTERRGASVSIDLNYHHTATQLFGLARIFIDEYSPSREMVKTDNSFAVEAAVGRLFRKGLYLGGPLAGLDSEKRVIAGGTFSTKLHRHVVSYLGYAKLATDSKYDNATRHRILFDLNKDEKLFLRLDWKTEGNRQEHCRLGVEFHTRIDKLNLPVYIEPLWNFPAKQIGIRLGTRL